jgi:RNA polymerase sigma-70 factor (ECF subfamily)
MYEQLSDADLIVALRQRDEMSKQKILLALYERYKNLVLKICYSHLGDYDEARDAFHDVFLKVMKNAEKIENPALFKSWLMSISRNLCVDRLRRSSYLMEQDPISQQIEVSCDERVEDRYVAEMDRQKILNHLTSCVQKLDPQDLSIFKLRWQGLKAAQILKIVPTQKTELRRSYDRIKISLERCMKANGLILSIDQIISLGEIDE